MPVFFTPFFFFSRRWELRKFVLAVLMSLVSVLMEGVVTSSLAAPAGSGRAMLRGSRGSRESRGTCGAAALIHLGGGRGTERRSGGGPAKEEKAYGERTGWMVGRGICREISHGVLGGLPAAIGLKSDPGLPQG